MTEESKDPFDVEMLTSTGFTTTNGNGENVNIRMYIPNDRNIVNSGFLYHILQTHYPEITNNKELFHTFIMLHRLNVGEFINETRIDNPLSKNEVRLNPDSFNQENLYKLGMDPDYLGGQRFSNQEVEKLFKIFELTPPS